MMDDFSNVLLKKRRKLVSLKKNQTNQTNKKNKKNKTNQKNQIKKQIS